MKEFVYPFKELNAEAKFAYAVSETFKAMHDSPYPALGPASDDFTILDFVEANVANKEIVDYILNDDTFPHNQFIEIIFALFNSFNLYEEDPA